MTQYGDFLVKALQGDLGKSITTRRPVIDEIATEKAWQVAVYKVDIDQSPDLAFKYQVSSVPTLIVFENGQIKNERLGAQPKQNILAML